MTKLSKSQRRRAQRKKAAERAAAGTKNNEASSVKKGPPAKSMSDRLGRFNSSRQLAAVSGRQFGQDVLPGPSKTAHAHSIKLQSYTRYRGGFRGSFGQFGTGVVEFDLRGQPVQLTVGVKSPLHGQTHTLSRELETLRRIQGIEIVPKLYGTACLNAHRQAVPYNLGTISPAAPTPEWGVVMERVTIPFLDWFRGSSASGSIVLRNSSKEPEAAIEFFSGFLSECRRGLQQLHKRGVAHLDIKPSNMGGVEKTGVQLPVTQNKDVRLVLFDYGLSASHSWKSGTRPYSLKSWFNQSPCQKRTNLEFVDYFQCLIVVMVLMADMAHANSYFRTDQFCRGAQVFASAWLQTNSGAIPPKRPVVGWLQFFLSHDHQKCDSPFHNGFCSPAQTKYAHLINDLVDMDRQFSSELFG